MPTVISPFYQLAAGDTRNILADSDFVDNFSLSRVFFAPYAGFRPGLVFDGNDTDPLVDVEIAGSLTVSGASGDIFGLFHDRFAPGFEGGTFSVASTGEFRTISTNTAINAITMGFFAPVHSLDLDIAGQFSVSAASGIAYGIYNDWVSSNLGAQGHSMLISGSLSVSGGTDGIGIFSDAFNNATTISNSGSISVNGDETATAVLIASIANIDFFNSGTITTTNNANSPFATIGILVDSDHSGASGLFEPSSYKNSGSITADVAFWSVDFRFEETFDNSGTVNGLILLGAGNDRLINTGLINGLAELGTGNDVFIGLGSTTTNFVFGDDGRDALIGDDGDDILYGGTGSDWINGGNGNDEVSGGFGGDALDGGAGRDLLTYHNSTTGIVADLTLGIVEADGTDRVRNFEIVLGSVFDDRITGSNRIETLAGLAGTDRLDGGGGRDVLWGGNDNDILTGGSGNDTFILNNGGGFDFITDFNPLEGDHIHVFGFSECQRVDQIGDDVMIIFSAFDRVTLKNFNVADLDIGQFQFFGREFILEPSAPPSRYQYISEDFLLAEGGELTIDSPGAPRGFFSQTNNDIGLLHIIEGDNGPDNIYLAGRLNIIADTPANTTVSLTGFLGNGSEGSSFQITETGYFSVRNNGGSDDPNGIETYGISSGSFSFPYVFNFGTLDVSAARGDVVGYNGTSLVNDGTIIATAEQGSATGAWIGFYAVATETFLQQGGWNSGDITVDGDEASIGVRFDLGTGNGLDAEFFNSGNIVVTDNTSAADSVGIFLQGGDQRVINSGLVQADYAINFDDSFTDDTRFLIYNSGTLDGKILAGDGTDIVRNIGTITGDINLGSRADIFDGRGGIQTGIVGGGNGADKLYTGDGNETLDGAGGNDFLAGGRGNDLIHTGAGFDTIYFAQGDGQDVVSDFDPSRDKFAVFGFSAYQSLAQQGSDTLVTFSAGNTVLLQNVLVGDLSGTNFDFNADALPVPDEIPVPNPVPTAGNAPTLGQATFLYSGTLGNDLIKGTADTNAMMGFAGNDRYIVNNTDDQIIEVENGGVDSVRARVDYTLPDFVENLTMVGGARYAEGNASGNRITGSNGQDEIWSYDGDDILRGGAARDSLHGGDGDDLLDGGPGKDNLFGGLGRDIYQFRDGDTSDQRPLADRINFFEQENSEIIDLRFMDANVNLAGDQAFTFIGDSAFSGTAGELRFDANNSQFDTYIMGDTDGDQIPDFYIYVANLVQFTESDFFL